MRILLPYCREEERREFYKEFFRGISEALRELGHEPVAFPFWSMAHKSEEELQRLYRCVSADGIDAIIDLCCWGYGLSQVAVGEGEESQPIFELFELPYVGMLFDHPPFQAIGSIRARRLYATYPDLGHPQQARLTYPTLQLEGEIFAPPAVRPASDRWSTDWSDRVLDVLYVGNLDVAALERFWRGASGSALADAMVDAALAQPERSLHLSMALAMGQQESANFDMLLTLRSVELFLRARFRRDAVTALARSGIRMCVVGRGWDAVGLPANVERIERTDYEGVFRLAGQAKICLDASTYLDGANDRVFTYVLNGAVCFTNAAGYLRDSLGADGCVRFYSMLRLGELGDQVRALLSRTNELRAAGTRGRQRVLESHTWRHRMSDVLAALDGSATGEAGSACS